MFTLRDIWPTDEEIATIVHDFVKADLYSSSYKHVLEGSEGWQQLEAGSGTTYGWHNDSTYLKCAPYFDGVRETARSPSDLHALRPLVLLGDSITTDHISPSGMIVSGNAASEYLTERGVIPPDFNTYGTRRGNHEVVMRSGFAEQQTA